MRRRLLIALLAALLPACQSARPVPTTTPALPTLPPPMAASPTVNPIPAVREGDTIDDIEGGFLGSSNPTQAALAAEGQGLEDAPTLTPQPTQPFLPMSITASDGLVLQATLYSAPQRPAPAALLLHDRGQDRRAWEPLAQRLQAAGFAVLAVDLRGYGATGGEADWTRAPEDVRLVVTMLAGLPGIDPARLAVVGAGIGANLGLNACADLAGCVAAVLLSPGLDYRGITTPEAMARMGMRAVFIAAGENDENNPADSLSLDRMAAGEHQLMVYPNGGHGTALLDAEPGLIELIAAWMSARVGVT